MRHPVFLMISKRDLPHHWEICHTQFSVLWAIWTCLQFLGNLCVSIFSYASRQKKERTVGHHFSPNKPSFPESYWVIPLSSPSRLNNSNPFNLFSEVLFASLQFNHFHCSPLESLQVFCIKTRCFCYWVHSSKYLILSHKPRQKTSSFQAKGREQTEG